ncbi:MAG: prepilin-type N-terminal cleavage/methylation domain-containing protein [Luteolibacter sp.]
MKSKSGMTLLELTVVILVLLSLISILFIGARAWKKGSDRSANILNVRNIQQAVRGLQNTKEKAPTDTVDEDNTIFGTGAYLKKPVPPVASGATAYTFGTTFGDPGVIFTTNAQLTATVGEYYYDAAEITAKTSDW